MRANPSGPLNATKQRSVCLEVSTRHFEGKPEAIQISPLVDPKENGPSTDDLKRFRDAGVDRVVLLSQKTVAATAGGKALELARHFAQVVERARSI